MDWGQELIRTTIVLAQQAEIQRSLFPAFVCIGDEMVLEFGDAYDACTNSEDPQRIPIARATERLSDYIDQLSGGNESFWCDPRSLSLDSRWTRMRELASEALDTIGIDDRQPRKSGAIYIGPMKSP